MKIELVWDGKTDSLVLDNLVSNLSNIHKSVKFSISRQSGLGDQLARARDLDAAKLINIFIRQRRSRRRTLKILVTSASFRQFTFGANVAKAGMIISTAALGRKPSHGLLAGFVCLYIADFIARSHADTLVHENPVGCIGDAHATLKQLKSGLARITICHRCREALRSAVSAGRISEQQVAALDRILDTGMEYKRCFILMPFKKRFDRLMTGVFQKLGGRNGWRVERADQMVTHPEAMNNILSGIRRADLIIADLTGSNPNVFYEAGFAHAIGRRVVLVTQDVSSVPFDLRAMNAHPYKMSDKGLRDLLKLLKTRYIEGN